MELELKNSIAWRLLARVRMEKIYMEWALGTNEKRRQLTYRMLLEFPYVPDPDYNHIRRSALSS